jgi:phosphonate transport system substrate-binding protein
MLSSVSCSYSQRKSGVNSTMFSKIKCAFSAVAILAVAITSPLLTIAEEAKPLIFAVTDIEGLEELQRDFGTFKDTLSQALGQPIEFFPLSSRTIAVEGLRGKRIDVVLTGPSEYVVIRAKAQAEPLVRFSRPDYFSCIVTKNDRAVQSLADLKGKKVAFGDIGSTAYHLGPMQLLKDAGLDPRNDIKPMNVAKNLGWEALKRGDVAALGVKYDQFIGFRDGEKDMLPAAFRVIARGADLPDDVLVAGAHVAPELRAKIAQVFTEKSDEFLAAILKGAGNDKYKGMKFIPDVVDADYNVVRQMYATIGVTDFMGEQG